MSIIKQTPKDTVSLTKQRSYTEIIEFLDTHHTSTSTQTSLERMTQLDALFSYPSKKITAITIAGTNGKSLTAHFTAKLLHNEGLTVGVFQYPHIITYNESLTLNTDSITNKLFTDFANEVINATESTGLTVTTREILTQMAINYFVKSNVDVVILESAEGKYDCTALYNAPVKAITRLIEPAIKEKKDLTAFLEQFANIITPDCYFVSADQNKMHLQYLQEYTKSVGAHWTMPIRKVVSLQYPFELIHGRCAALAERIASLFIHHVINKNGTVIIGGLLTQPKEQRGRPTLEAKRRQEQQPRKTIENFWKGTVSNLPGRFQFLEKEKPGILLDNADNSDALNNLFLGIRLLHYRHAFKGFVLLLNLDTKLINTEQFAKEVRYFFKKTPGQLILCPSKQATYPHQTEQFNTALKEIKFKAKIVQSFSEGLEIAKKLVNERNGLIAIAGSSTIISEYWNIKGIKKN